MAPYFNLITKRNQVYTITVEKEKGALLCIP